MTPALDPRLQNFDELYTLVHESKLKLHFTVAGNEIIIRPDRKSADVLILPKAFPSFPPFAQLRPSGDLNPTPRLRNCDITWKRELWHLLTQLQSDPMPTLTAHGKQTGTCCVCGRTLTDPESIAAGIGPVCGGRVRQAIAYRPSLLNFE